MFLPFYYRNSLFLDKFRMKNCFHARKNFTKNSNKKEETKTSKRALNSVRTVRIIHLISPFIQSHFCGMSFNKIAPIALKYLKRSTGDDFAVVVMFLYIYLCIKYLIKSIIFKGK